MGDNANVSRDWHNTVVGQGYQAKGVIRQKSAEYTQIKVFDLRSAKPDTNKIVTSCNVSDQHETEQGLDNDKKVKSLTGKRSKVKKLKKDKKVKSKSKSKKRRLDHLSTAESNLRGTTSAVNLSDDNDSHEIDNEVSGDEDQEGHMRFNPLMQLLISKLSTSKPKIS